MATDDQNTTDTTTDSAPPPATKINIGTYAVEPESPASDPQPPNED